MGFLVRLAILIHMNINGLQLGEGNDLKTVSGGGKL